MKREAVACIIVEPGFRTLPHHDFGKFNERPPFPTLWDALYDCYLLVTGEAEVNEPLAIEKPRRLLQQRNPPSVIFHQVVIDGEDRDDSTLLIRAWRPNSKRMKHIAVHTGNCGLFGFVIPKGIAQQICDEARIIALEVNHIKGSIQWPVWFLNEKNLANSPV